MKRALLTALTSTALAGTLLAPAAHAQSPLDLIADTVSTLDCRPLDTALTVSGAKNTATTRSELVANLRAYAGDDVTLKLLLNNNVNAVADRAVECSIVHPDPALPAGSAALSRYVDLLGLFSSTAGR